MAGINPGAKDYRASFSATESVLVFWKAGCSRAEEINYVPDVVQPVRSDILGPLGKS
jgi:hypothetical protein